MIGKLTFAINQYRLGGYVSSFKTSVLYCDGVCLSFGQRGEEILRIFSECHICDILCADEDLSLICVRDREKYLLEAGDAFNIHTNLNPDSYSPRLAFLQEWPRKVVPL